MLEVLPAGSKILAHKDLYGGVHRLIADLRPKTAGHRVEFVDFTDAKALETAAQSGVDLMWFETPSNPLLRIVDLQAVAKIGSASSAITVCDSTFASPVGQLPLDHGIDVVMHSATKFLGGHSDLLGGVLAVSRSAKNGLAERIGYLQNALGAVMCPTECALMLRSLKTLMVRVRQQASNAEMLAHALDENRKEFGIRDVLFPGLKSHPGHEIAARQMANFGSLVSIRIEGGPKRVEQVLTRCSLFHFAVSLGGVESLIQHPAPLTHAAVPEDHRAETGVGPDLIRLALGIEDFEDLKSDLWSAFKS